MRYNYIKEARRAIFYTATFDQGNGGLHPSKNRRDRL